MCECANVLICEPLLFQVAYLDDTDITDGESKILDDMYENSFYSVQVSWIEYAPLSVILLLLWVE